MPSEFKFELPDGKDQNSSISNQADPSPESENMLAQTPRVQEVIRELREKIEQKELSKTRPGRGEVPDWEKIYSFLEEEGFPAKRDKRGNAMEYSATDGTSIENKIINFWVHIGFMGGTPQFAWKKTLLEQATKYTNNVESIKELLETERHLDAEIELLEEIFRIIGASKVRRGNETIYVFSDGEIPLQRILDFFHYRNQTSLVKAHLKRTSDERREADLLREEGKNWWKKYD
ncbi:MAG: hypothetical protein A3B13_01965 [Candidatus Liptonbacteria bacterium RIFCSPLOWO2_01_FULL_45_15]|uniref:Uncharacterized protein n=1 Tax=Candidatus Liptonbacteria bacterium RIFCSPLOWO2_01_FULL_45_15 TaxID=1798649 RepID=A0A1G2CEV9_9BACT|nr:MAG: hypothetical protein A3B13_01965 [Candidatus Liptonbacteria bacterium RIFCSPLOWO2_01_FULL_45_15]